MGKGEHTLLLVCGLAIPHRLRLYRHVEELHEDVGKDGGPHEADRVVPVDGAEVKLHVDGRE